MGWGVRGRVVRWEGCNWTGCDRKQGVMGWGVRGSV